MEGQMKGLVKFLSGVILGAGVGATLAILLTPNSGEALRSQVKNSFQQLQDEMKQAAETRRGELEQQLAVLREPNKPTA
jgi:gas vesicle protein